MIHYYQKILDYHISLHTTTTTTTHHYIAQDDDVSIITRQSFGGVRVSRQGVSQSMYWMWLHALLECDEAVCWWSWQECQKGDHQQWQMRSGYRQFHVLYGISNASWRRRGCYTSPPTWAARNSHCVPLHWRCGRRFGMGRLLQSDPCSEPRRRRLCVEHEQVRSCLLDRGGSSCQRPRRPHARPAR